MKKIFFLLIALSFGTIAFCKGTILGKWEALNEKTGKPYAVVELTASDDGIVSGKIINLIPEDIQKAKCIHCPGDFKDQPLEGMKFVWGLKPLRHDKWGNGTIIDPYTGKIYHAQLKRIKNKLYVRSYVGMPILGRTQIWKR